ncbi:MAG TPA: histidine kinase [Luteimonas sp.]|jgi:two-component system sensor histidine kinase AlgZ|nr:histidine kinase [Luteimonas sp.]
MDTGSERPAAADPWLPDLCRLPRLATLFGVAELVMVVLALAPDGGNAWTPVRFAAASAFALWLAVAVASLLCTARNALSRLSVPTGSAVAVAGAFVVALACAAIGYQLDRNLYGLVPENVTMARFALGCAVLAAVIAGVALRYLYVIDGWQAQVRASARAQADALQARIRPHFLFNSLNAIIGLVRRDPLVAEHALLDLSDLFRAALDAGDGVAASTLRGEVELAERYLAIEALRLGPRLAVEWDRQEPLPWDLPLPRLVLQPLVENAVLHGVSRLPGGGAVRISIRADAGLLRVSVDNPAPPEGIAAAATGAGHAQRSIGHRLAYAFGSRAGLTTGREAGYYRCELRVPLDAAVPT